jgi:hypothetical protein
MKAPFLSDIYFSPHQLQNKKSQTLVLAAEQAQFSLVTMGFEASGSAYTALLMKSSNEYKIPSTALQRAARGKKDRQRKCWPTTNPYALKNKSCSAEFRLRFAKSSQR